MTSSQSVFITAYPFEILCKIVFADANVADGTVADTDADFEAPGFDILNLEGPTYCDGSFLLLRDAKVSETASGLFRVNTVFDLHEISSSVDGSFKMLEGSAMNEEDGQLDLILSTVQRGLGFTSLNR